MKIYRLGAYNSLGGLFPIVIPRLMKRPERRFATSIEDAVPQKRLTPMQAKAEDIVANPTKHVEHANVNAIRADACADEGV
jgi:hypothetical protein